MDFSDKCPAPRARHSETIRVAASPERQPRTSEEILVTITVPIPRGRPRSATNSRPSYLT
jgi:hypothetical protein